MRRKAVEVLIRCGVFLAISPAAWGSGEQAALVISTAGRRTTYQIGERIPIDLSFTGPDTKQFEITMASYDRSGRMSYEQFEVEPSSGWSDPLAVYFGSQAGFIGGGLSSLGVLSPTPTVMHLNLNEWIRFEQPGNYTVVDTSHRVGDSLDASRTISHPSDFTLDQTQFTSRSFPPATAGKRHSWRRSSRNRDSSSDSGNSGA
jgi:hypothetical protein